MSNVTHNDEALPAPSAIDIEIFHSVDEVGQAAWDALSAGRPFTSYQWYRFGEQVMRDCPPVYMIASYSGQPVGRATFWKIAAEPLPVPALFQGPASGFMRRWPLLMCRSPFSSASGLILPEPSPLCQAVQTAFAARAGELLQQERCSFLVFDFLPEEQCSGWPADLVLTSISDPGTFMLNRWDSFEHYLADNKKVRRHYQYIQNKARAINLTITVQQRVDRMEEALTLVRRVEKSFGSAPNIWVKGMMENLAMVNGSWVTATVGAELVGCNIIMEDGSAHMNTALGKNDLPYVYLAMIYENLKVAFEHGTRLLRWGSGAYEFKQTLGFVLENSNHALFTARNPFLRAITRFAK
jgi:hypothetical protein